MMLPAVMKLPIQIRPYSNIEHKFGKNNFINRPNVLLEITMYIECY